jgi:hypothetical protein
MFKRSRERIGPALARCVSSRSVPRFTLGFDTREVSRVRDGSRGRQERRWRRTTACVALLYPEPEKGGRGKKSKNDKETLGFSIMRLSQGPTRARWRSKCVTGSPALMMHWPCGGGARSRRVRRIPARQLARRSARPRRIGYRGTDGHVRGWPPRCAPVSRPMRRRSKPASASSSRRMSAIGKPCRHDLPAPAVPRL